MLEAQIDIQAAEANWEAMRAGEKQRKTAALTFQSQRAPLNNLSKEFGVLPNCGWAPSNNIVHYPHLLDILPHCGNRYTNI